MGATDNAWQTRVSASVGRATVYAWDGRLGSSMSLKETTELKSVETALRRDLEVHNGWLEREVQMSEFASHSKVGNGARQGGDSHAEIRKERFSASKRPVKGALNDVEQG